MKDTTGYILTRSGLRAALATVLDSMGLALARSDDATDPSEIAMIADSIIDGPLATPTDITPLLETEEQPGGTE